MIYKDIPLLEEYLGEKFTTALVKGRSNYLCLRQWGFMQKEVDAEKLPLFLRIIHWLFLTETGDYSELNLFGKEYELFQRFAAHSETCASVSCPYLRQNCYISRIRKLAAQANIIIINRCV